MLSHEKEEQHALLKNGEADTSLESDQLYHKTIKPGAASRISALVYRTVFLVSVVANIVLGIALHREKQSDEKPEVFAASQRLAQEQAGSYKTPYAGLEYNVNGTWEYETPYAQENITAADEMWMAVDISNAFVALSKEEAKEMNLPPSIPFPWDLNHKDLYLISSVHSMHCLTVLHRSNLEFRTNHTQTYSTEHILHCLDNLRVDIQCNADDTPRFIPPDAVESTAKTGVGQIRQCRDWSQLNEWTNKHSACFSYNRFLYQELTGNKIYPWAYEYCDKDSEYLSTVQKYFRKNSSWIYEKPGWPDKENLGDISD